MSLAAADISETTMCEGACNSFAPAHTLTVWCCTSTSHLNNKALSTDVLQCTAAAAFLSWSAGPVINIRWLIRQTRIKQLVLVMSFLQLFKQCIDAWRSHDGTVQICGFETGWAWHGRRTGADTAAAVHGVHLRVSTASNSSRSSPAPCSRRPADVNSRMRRQATAAQRPQQVALKTVVDEAVDDGIHATVAETEPTRCFCALKSIHWWLEAFYSTRDVECCTKCLRPQFMSLS